MWQPINTQTLGLLTLPLISNNTLKRLQVGYESVTDLGLVPLLEALPRLCLLKELGLHCTLSNPDETLKMIGESVERSTMVELRLSLLPPSLHSEETITEWVKSVMVGGSGLIHSLKSCQVTKLVIVICLQKISFPIDRKLDVQAQLLSSLQKSVTFTNSEREKNFTNPLYVYVTCY